MLIRVCSIKLVAMALIIVISGISPLIHANEAGHSEIVSIKTVGDMRFYTAKHRMTAFELAQEAQGLATRLGMSLIRSGGERDGPLHILFENKQESAAEEQELLLAFPSRGNPRSSGRYRSIKTPPFKCTFLTYEGPADGIRDAWVTLVDNTRDAGYTTSGKARYVFGCDGSCSEELVFVELQLGIE